MAWISESFKKFFPIVPGIGNRSASEQDCRGWNAYADLNAYDKDFECYRISRRTPIHLDGVQCGRRDLQAPSSLRWHIFAICPQGSPSYPLRADRGIVTRGKTRMRVLVLAVGSSGYYPLNHGQARMTTQLLITARYRASQDRMVVGEMPNQSTRLVMGRHAPA